MTTRSTAPRSSADRFQEAIELHQRGRLREAEGLYRGVLDGAPEHFGALHHLGVVRAQQGDAEDAIHFLRRALASNPRSVEALGDLGVVLEGARRHAEAVSCYEEALALDPQHATTLFNLGNALQALQRHEEAARHYERALALRPGDAETHCSLGNALHALHRSDEAIAQYEQALALRPRYAKAHNNLGVALAAAGRVVAAIEHYRKALSLDARFAAAHANLGEALVALGQRRDAVAHLQRALALDPDNAPAHNNLGNALLTLRRFDEAIACFERAIELDPEEGNALSCAVMLGRRRCDWRTGTRKHGDLIAALESEAKPILPFALVASTDDPALHLRVARKYIRDMGLDRLPAVFDGGRYAHEKIRLAYLSADFHEHATAYLMAELFELHDRRRFEVVAVSWGPDDGSDMRRRLLRSFDRFLDVREKSDLEVARELRRLEIDVAVDLKGFTQDSRLGILARRPAPIQVNYLGYPGSLGADFIDYAIVDPVAVPPDLQAHFSERLVHLPDSYQATDRKRPIAPRTPSRAECGLPERVFVLACFNSPYKLTPEVFDIWMRLLRTLPDAVLWLLDDNESATANLRREAEARGVAASRLVFAPYLPPAEHLARQRCADLFLDALPYNAHTTASDALWAGLPLVTCIGRSFPARVAASLLRAVGLPELVTATLEDYEALALRLAREPALLAGLRERLARNRTTAPLFDSDRFRRHIEQAYETMWACWQSGGPPRPFAVEALPE